MHVDRHASFDRKSSPLSNVATDPSKCDASAGPQLSTFSCDPVSLMLFNLACGHFHLALHDSPVSTGVDIQEEAMVLSDLTKAAQKLFKLQTTLRSSLLFATHLVGLVIPNSSTVLPPANRASEGLGRLQGLGQGRERPFRSTLPQLVPCRASLALTIHMPDSRNADPLPEIRRVLFSFQTHVTLIHAAPRVRFTPAAPFA